MARIGDSVRWKWASGHGEGTIEDRFERRVQRTLKGSRVVKNGSSRNPALLIRQDNGAKVLKLQSELD
jgi:hypothetical protein